MNMIAVIGASGYVGKHLIAELAKIGTYRVKVLTRKSSKISDSLVWPVNIEIVEADLQDKASLQGFLEPGCTVINLAYLWHAGEQGNLTAIRNLLDACKDAKVARLIHCSTSIVVGKSSEALITEDTPCSPTTEYELTKYKLELEVLKGARGNFDSVILRPTSVFGPDAPPIRKLTDDLVGGNRFLNYLKSCFLGRRRMNLVPIKNLVAAILFMVNHRDEINGEVFIVSNDDELGNNFADIERTLISQLNCKGHIFMPIPLPYSILNLVFKLLGKKTIKPSCNYSPEKLHKFGFSNPVSFNEGLLEYADWYKSTCLINSEVPA